MAVVQDMLTAKMAELQKSLASEVSKMREGNLAMLDAAGITSRAVESGKEAITVCMQQAKIEGDKVQKSANQAASSVQDVESTIGEMTTCVSDKLKYVEDKQSARSNADKTLSNTIVN